MKDTTKIEQQKNRKKGNHHTYHKKNNEKINEEVNIVKTDTNTTRDDINYSIKYIVYLLLIIIFALLASIYFIKSKEDNKKTLISYDESASATWNVNYLSDYYSGYANNDYSYVRKFTSSIDINFKYALSFTDDVIGSRNYKITSRMEIYDPSDKNTLIWSTDTTELVNKELKDTNDFSTYNISDTVNINYQDYLNQYQAFKDQSGINSFARIIVELTTSSTFTYDKQSKTENGIIDVYIPVSDQTYKITTSLNDISNNTQKIYSNTVNSNSFRYQFIGLFFISITGIFIILLCVIYHKDKKRIGIYQNTLNKILKTYDNVIVNVDKLPELTDKNIIKVSSFAELMDAQMEIRIPINFKENKTKKEATFVLIQDSVAWVYILKEKDINKSK